MQHALLTALIITAVAVPAAAEKIPCSAEIVLTWQKLLNDKCELPDIEDRLPISLKLLRNTPFAVRSYRFESPELRTFFSKANTGCDGGWYDPSKEEVKLEGEQLACAQKLRELENTARKKIPMPRALETYLLENLAGELVGELVRTVHGQKGGSRVYVTRNKDGGWQLNFLDSFEHEGGDTTESSVIVMCDAKGEGCRVAMAG